MPLAHRPLEQASHRPEYGVAGIVPGPVIAGALVEGYGYFPLSVMALVAGLGCMIMFLGVMTRLEASEAPQSLA